MGNRKVKPLRDQVLVRRQRISEKRGIIVPNQAEAFVFTAEAVGPDVKGVRPGQELILASTGGSVTMVDMERDDLCLIEEALVRGVWEIDLC